MDNITKVHFNPDEDYIWDIQGLEQWDKCQKLEISGLDISDEIVEVHFSLDEVQGNAERMYGTVKDGIIHADIPAFVLEGPGYCNGIYLAYAWVYVSDEESAETIRKMEFEIKARPKPEEYVTPDELSFLQQLEQAIKSKITTPTSAKVGQLLSVKTVDENGKPTEFDVVDQSKGAEVTVDNALSEESTNPVQNQVVTKEVKALQERNAKLEETVEKLQIKTTTSPSPFHHITDSANMKVVDFGMEGKTEQYTGTITDDEGNEVTVPNPTHPQEIKLAGVYNEETGRYEHKCCMGNKNWFDLKVENVAYVDNLYKPTITDIENGIEISFQNTRNACVVLDTKLYPNKTYTISCNVSIEADNAIDKAFNVLNVSATKSNWYRGDIAFAKYTAGKNTLTFTTTDNTEDTKVYLAAWSLVNNTTGKATITDFQIEIDSLATDVIEHASQQFTLTSPVPLTKWDYLTKRDGVYGWSVNSVHNSEFTSSNVPIWTLYGEKDGVYVYRSTISDKTSGWQTSVCKTFKNVNGSYNKYALWSYSDISSNSSIFFCTNFATVEEWKAYLDENPLDIWYKTAEEQAFIPLPDEEQELLHNLETYYGVTNLYNDQGCPMWLTYVADTKLYTDQQIAKQIAQTQALILEN